MSRSTSSSSSWSLPLGALRLALTGCSGAADDSGGGNDSAKGGAAQSRNEAAAGPGAGDFSAEKGQRADKPPKATASHIIRKASLTVRVKNVPKALDEVRSVTEDAGGYIGNETTTRDGKGRERTKVVLRVPVAPFVYFMTVMVAVTGVVHLAKVIFPSPSSTGSDLDPEQTGAS